jgi:hypothetical protein
MQGRVGSGRNKLAGGWADSPVKLVCNSVLETEPQPVSV